MRTDRLASALLDFPGGQAVFTCSTQLVPYQRAQILGTKGRIEVQIPVNTPPDKPTRIWIDNGADLVGGGVRTEEFPACDQYTIQGDLFSIAVRGQGQVPTPLEDSIRNMAVIEPLFRSAREDAWERPERKPFSQSSLRHPKRQIHPHPRHHQAGNA